MNATATAVPVKHFGSIDDLETSLVESWQAVSQATHRFLVLLREFDLRQGYKAYGNADCVEWLNWKCGIARVTAQEKVRVARALWNLPQIDAAFAKGDLSYSKVRAITRVASGCNETDLLDYALTVSASQLDRFCAELKHGDATDSQTAARRAREGRSLTRYFREDGTGVMTVELPRAELELILKAVEEAALDLPADEDRSLFATAADALVTLAQEFLADPVDTVDTTDTSDSKQKRSSAGDAFAVLVRVDADALAGEGGRSDLPLPVVRRLCCDGSMVPVIENGNRDVLNVGRKQRTIPRAIRRALEARDNRCQFPGCTHERWLDAHHIQHWAEGGETSLENLVLLCSHHHTLMHEGGFQLRERRDGSHFFARPDGQPLEAGVREEQAVYRIGPSSAEDGGELWHNRAFLARQAWRLDSTGGRSEQQSRYHTPGWLGQVL